MNTYLITGGSGFIGSRIVQDILKSEPNSKVIVLDRLDKSSTYDRIFKRNLTEEQLKRLTILWHDLKAPINDYLGCIFDSHRVDTILHLAATTHVDRAIVNPIECVQDNVMGTLNLLEWFRQYSEFSSAGERFLYFSTDEVFGPSAENETFKEWDRYNSSNPYAASKAGAEELCLAYANTYSLRVQITHTMNIFGSYQHREKFIPKCIWSLLNDQQMPIHCDKKGNSGSRFWLHVSNVWPALSFILKNTTSTRDKYNIVGEKRVTNLEVYSQIANIMGKKPNYCLYDYHSSRPGHDLHYGLDGTKLATMGHKHEVNFEASLMATVTWYLENQEWL